MQKQKAGQNNPANPLMKCAALSIGKVYEDEALRNIKINASLTFKRSPDMIGHTRTKYGQSVTVNFTLSLRRASFELAFEREGRATLASSVKIKRVTHTKPTSLRATSHETQSEKNTKKGGVALDGSLSGGLGQAGLVPSAGGRIAGSFAESREKSHKLDISLKKVEDGVSATFTDSKILWEIGAVSLLETVPKMKEYLDGDVFARKDGGLGATCSLKRIDVDGVITTTGSVFVRMQDLLIEDVRFTDENGDDVRLKALEGASNNPLRITEDVKLTVMKQIIRRHLVDVGMRVDGSRVEICRANV